MNRITLSTGSMTLVRAARSSLLKQSFFTLAIASAAILASTPAQAVTSTWSGSAGSTDWITGGVSGNWTGAAAPVTTNPLIFGANASSSNTLTNTLTSASFNVGGITFNAGAPAYTMTGNTFNLTGGITNNSSNLQTFSNTGGLTAANSLTYVVSPSGGISINALGMTTTGNATMTVNGTGGTLTLGSWNLAAAGTAAAFNDAIAGSGNMAVTGTISNGPGSFAGSVAYAGTGTLTLSGANTYTGTTSLTGTGTLTLNTTSSTSNTTLNSGNGSGIASLAAVGATLNLGTATALGSSGSLTLTYGTFDNSSAGTLTLSTTNTTTLSSSAYVTFGGTHDLNFGPGALAIGSSTLNLNGTGSTLTWASAVNSGTAGIVLTVNGSGNNLVLGSYSLTTPTASTPANISFGGNANITLTNGAPGGNSPAGAFAYAGLGTLTMGGTATSNTYTGGTTVSHGTFILNGGLSPNGGGVTASGGIIKESGSGVIGNTVPTTATVLTLSGGTTTTPGGMVILSGSNTSIVNPTLNLGSTLTLDFSGSGAPTTNILSTTSTVTASGGTLLIKGASGATNSETLKFSGNTLASNNIVLNTNGASSLTLSTSMSRNGSYGTLDITMPTGSSVFFTSGTGTGLAGGLLVSSTTTAYATANGGTTWATYNASTFAVGALATASYATGSANYLTANNVDVGTDTLSSATTTAGSLRFNGSGRSVTITGTTNTLALNTDGILVTPGSSGSISGGNLSNSNKELVINDYGTLNISSVISGSAAGLVTVGGPGVTTFSGAGTYLGTTNIDVGSTLVVSNLGSGTSGTANNGLGGSAVTMSLGSTLDLRNDGAGGTSPGTVTFGNAFGGSGVMNIDVNDISSGVTNKTLALGGVTYGTQQQFNITGGNGYSLALGAFTTGGATSGSVILNPTTANVSVASFTGATTGANNFIVKLDGTSTGNSIGAITNGAGGGTVGVTKLDSSVWTLTGANTYTGGTLLGGGTLTLAAGSGASLAAAGTLNLNGTGIFNLDNTSAAGAVSQSMGALTFSAGDGTIRETQNSGSNTELITFSSLAARGAGAAGNFVNNGGTPSATNGFVLTGQTTGYINQGLFFNGGNYAYYDSGGFVRGINYSGDALAATAGAGTTLSPVASLTGTTVTTSGTITMASTTGLVVGDLVNAANIPVGSSIIAINPGVSITISATPSSAAATALTFWNQNLQTTGAVTAQTNATFRTLNLAGTGTGAGTNDFTLASGATLVVQGILRSGNAAGSSATISGGLGLSVGPVANDFVVRTDGSNDSLTINTPISGASGSANLVKSGAGTLTLGTLAVDTFYGSTFIDQGILNFSQDSNFGGLATGSPTINLNGGTLQAGASNVVLGAYRNVVLSANNGVQTIDTNGNTLTINGAVSGGIQQITAGGFISTGVLNKIGTGTLILNGTDTYLSQTLITAGTLQLGNGGTSGAIDASGVITDNGIFAIDRSNAVLQGYDFLPAITGSGGVTQLGSGTTTFTALNTYTGPTLASAGTLQNGISNAIGSSSAVTIGGGTWDVQTFSDTVASFTQTSGSLNGSGTVTAATYALQGGTINAKLGAGTATVTSGTTNLNGTLAATTVNINSGTLQNGASNVVASGANVSLGGGTWAISTFGNVVNGITLSSGSITGTTGVLNSTTGYDVRSGSISALLGGSSVLTKSTTGTVTLSGTSSNTYSGLTSVNDGELDLNKTSALAVPGNLTVGDSIGSANSAIAKLLGASQIATSSAVTINSDGKFDLNGQSATVASVTSNGGTITGGTVTTTAAPSFTGTGNTIASGATVSSSAQATVATGASLAVNGTLSDTISVAGSGGLLNGAGTVGAVTLASGSTLGGTLTTGPITGSGTIAPGNSPGILTASSVTVGSGGANFKFEMTSTTGPSYLTPTASGNDVLHLTDTSAPIVGVATTANVFDIYFNTLTLAAGNSYVGGIFTDKSSNFYSLISGGTYNYWVAVSSGATTTYNGQGYETLAAYNNLLSVSLSAIPITADFGSGPISGFEEQFAVVPEPGTWALMLGGLAALVVIQRRRKQG